MKIYLASRYENRIEMQKWAGLLENHGHTVTSRWILGGHEITTDAKSDGERQRFALEDLADVCAADVLIFHSPERFHRSGRGGRHVELGIAIAKGMRIIGVGKPENVFHCLPGIKWVFSLQEAIINLL